MSRKTEQEIFESTKVMVETTWSKPLGLDSKNEIALNASCTFQPLYEFLIVYNNIEHGKCGKKSKYDFKILKDSNLARALFYVNSFVRKE